VTVLVQVTQTFDALTSLTATLQTSTTENFASPVQLTAATLPLASLVVGAKFLITHVPESVPTACEATMLTATLTRPGTITAADITLASREPTLALCRALVNAGHADQPMTVVDSATGWPTMHVRSIAAAAMLTVDEGHGCRFARWRPSPGKKGAPGVASDHAGVPETPSGPDAILEAV
jgi:hypothetical protein